MEMQYTSTDCDGLELRYDGPIPAWERNAQGLVYGSVCSGIEAATVAWEPLGWRPAFFAEIEPFPSAVLAHRHPAIPNLGDMTAIDGSAWRGKIDVLVGGTPCQSFSVAGLRKSLDDARGNLSLKFVELADAIDPAWIVWENVPGVLFTRDNAFGCLLGGLAGEDGPVIQLGGKWTNAGVVVGPTRTVAWRVLDAQYFGLAQRRRRVFVVAGPRDGADPVAVLFERQGVRRDSPPGRETEQDVAGTLAGGSRRRGGFSFDDLPIAFGGNNTSGPIDVATALNACTSASGRMDFETETFIAHSLRGDVAAGRDNGRDNGGGNGGGQLAVQHHLGVRRLTPCECERLQGFPDDHTRIPWRNKPAEACPDGPRYRSLGNSMAVPVMRWIGRRIQAAGQRP